MQEGSHHSVIGVAHCAYTVRTIRFILNILHSSESLTILVCARQKVSRQPAASKNPGEGASLVDISHMLSLFLAGELSVSCGFHWERLWEARAQFPLDLTSCAFSLC